jgi:hypothetical protein
VYGSDEEIELILIEPPARWPNFHELPVASAPSQIVPGLHERGNFTVANSRYRQQGRLIPK